MTIVIEQAAVALEQAFACELPETLSSTAPRTNSGNVSYTHGGATFRTQRGPVDQAPDPGLVLHLLALLTNGPEFEDRLSWVGIAMAAKGASNNDARVRQAFIDWSWQDDPNEAARVWDTGTPRAGWQALVNALQKQDPDAAHQLRVRWAKCEFAPVGDDEGPDPRPTMKPSKALQARDKLKNRGMALHRSTEGNPIMSIEGCAFDLDSQHGGRELQAYLTQIGAPPSRHVRAELIDTLIGEALNSPMRDFPIRFHVTQGGDRLYLDLCDDQRRLVEITQTGWRILRARDTDVLFLRPPQAKALPLPVRVINGPPLEQYFARHFNLPTVNHRYDPKDAGTQARAGLLMAVAGWMRPIGAVPHVVFSGPNGCGKSTNADRLKGLLDPSGLGRSLSPGKVDDLFAISRSQGIVILDNLSSIKSEISDALCALSTGAALSKRALYTNAEATTLQAKRPGIFTAIKSDIIKRPDLAERSVQIPLTALATRKTEAELNADWSADHAEFLGAVCDALVASLKNLPAAGRSLNAADLPRLADAALFAEAMAIGLGWPPKALIQAIKDAGCTAADRLIDNDPLANLIDSLVSEGNGIWEGDLHSLGSEFHPNGLPRGFENNPRAIRSWLDRIEQPLRDALGIRVKHSQNPKTRRRQCKFERV
jgi:hypothetical protein